MPAILIVGFVSKWLNKRLDKKRQRIQEERDMFKRLDQNFNHPINLTDYINRRNTAVSKNGQTKYHTGTKG